MKKNDTLAKSLKNAVKEVVGSCLPLGVTFEGLKPKEAISVINSGQIRLGIIRADVIFFCF